jgi:hypothetical protein
MNKQDKHKHEPIDAYWSSPPIMGILAVYAFGCASGAFITFCAYLILT